MYVKLEGDEEMIRELNKIINEFPKKVASSMYKRAEEVMTISKRDFCPVDIGTLQGTGFVDQPEIENTTFGKGGNISVQLSYGGPAAPYATEQHENLFLVHPGKGESKYLETPLKAAARTMASDIAKDIKL